MHARIISRNELFVKSLERYIRNVFSGVEVANLFLINAADSLDAAKQHAANQQNVVLLLGVAEEEDLLNHQDFKGILALANVSFVNLSNIKDILRKYQEIVNGEKKFDSVLLAISENEEFGRKVAVLRHDFPNVRGNSDKYQDWLQKAKDLGFSGDTTEELIDQVLFWHPDEAGAFQGKFLEGIFVDAFETLFSSSWKLDPVIMLSALRFSRENKKKVFVISDSEKEVVQEILKKYNLDWPLLSKYELRGSTLEFVIDNSSQDVFEQIYDIKAQSFMSVSELKELSKSEGRY